MGKLKTYQLYDRIKTRTHLAKVNSESLQKAAPRLWARLPEKDEEFAQDLSQAVLVCHLDMIVAVLNFLGSSSRGRLFRQGPGRQALPDRRLAGSRTRTIPRTYTPSSLLRFTPRILPGNCSRAEPFEGSTCWKQIIRAGRRVLWQVSPPPDRRRNWNWCAWTCLGRKGTLAQISKEMGKLAPEERARIGKLLNAAKQELEAALEARKAGVRRRRAARAAGCRMGGPDAARARPAAAATCIPITQIQREIEELFVSLGFTVLDGPEVETEYYNFDALNIPADHPARDMQDTFWLDGGNLLRTHTSPVQVRGMERLGPPLRMIAPGRVFRNESVDASPRAHVLSARRHDGGPRRLRGAPDLLHEDAAHRDLPARRDGAAAPGLFPVRRARLRAGYPVPDLRRPGLPGLQAERLGGAAALRPGESERAAHERHRPGRVERLRLRPGTDAPGDDALRHRRHPPACRAAI